MEREERINIDECLRVGTFVNTHGVRGEIKVYPHTDDVNRFSDLEYVYMQTKEGLYKINIASVRYFKNMAIVKFKGIDNINDIEKYKGSDLYVTREQAVPLEENEYFICDIIDAKVISDDGANIGTVKDVMQTGANDVYVVVTDSGEEILIPVTPECVLDLDFENKTVHVHMLDGLMEMNRKKK